MSQPIVNPPVPYVCPFDGPVYPGKMIRLRGYAAPNGARFDINFQTRPTTYESDDIALHISVRLLQGYIARNSFRDGNWEDEEGHGDLPVLPGQQFEMLILIEDTQFKIAINGRHYCDFRHRLPYQSITHFGVEGDVTLSLISFEGNPPMYGGGQPGGYGMPQSGMYAPGAPYSGMPSAPPPYSQAVNMPPMPPMYGGGQEYQYNPPRM